MNELNVYSPEHFMVEITSNIRVITCSLACTHKHRWLKIFKGESWILT